jgi:hypothetical protein
VGGSGGDGGSGGSSAGSGGGGEAGGGGQVNGGGTGAGVAFPANSPSYTPIVEGAAGFGFNWTIPATWHVYHITSLSPGTGQGTYRDCVTGTWTGLRICVFDVSGTITFPTPTPNGTIIATTNPYLIEAWQTAPAPGVLIVNAKRTYRANNVLVWHAALMNSKPFLTADGYSANSGSLFEFNGASPSISNAVCVNCTGMFSSDEPFSTWKETSGASYYQSLSGWNSDSGSGHGSLFAGNGQVSVIRSVFANNKIRNPRFANLLGETIAYRESLAGSFGRQPSRNFRN